MLKIRSTKLICNLNHVTRELHANFFLSFRLFFNSKLNAQTRNFFFVFFRKNHQRGKRNKTKESLTINTQNKKELQTKDSQSKIT